MELRTLYEKRNCDEISDPLDKSLSEVKPIAIKPAWKQSRIFEPYAVTYVSPVPTDRYNFVKWVVLLQGIAMFLPTNMFINAETFFQYFKFKTIESQESVGNTTVGNLIDDKHLIFYFCITSSASSLIAIIFNVLLPISPTWSLTRRFTLSAVLQALVISLIVIVAIADTTGYHSIYLFISLTFVILLYVSNGLFQTCVHAMTAFLPIDYRRTLIFGLYFGGSLITGLQIISIALIENQRLSYIYFFVVSILVLLFSYDVYYTSPFSRFYRYYRNKCRIDWHKEYYECLEEPSKQWSLSSVLSKSWNHYLNIYLVCLVSYSIYPSLSLNAKPVPHSLRFIPNQYFNPITTHLVFNISSSLGSLSTALSDNDTNIWPKLWFMSGLRLLLIPLYVFLYFSPESHRLLVFVNNDLSHLLVILMLGLSNGYLLTTSVMRAPKSVRPEQSVISGMLSAFFFSSGLMSGAIVSLLIYIFVA